MVMMAQQSYAMAALLPTPTGRAATAGQHAGGWGTGRSDAEDIDMKRAEAALTDAAGRKRTVEDILRPIESDSSAPRDIRFFYRLMSTLGQESDSFEVALSRRVEDLRRAMAFEHENVCRVFLDCVEEAPFTTSLYANLMGLACNQSQLQYWADQLNLRLDKAMRAVNGSHIKLLTRFMGDLVSQSLLEPDAFVQQLSAFIDAAIASSTNPARADFYAYLAAISILWHGGTLQHKASEAFDALMQKCTSYFESSRRATPISDFEVVWLQTPAGVSLDPMQAVWAAVLSCRDASWQLARISHSSKFELTPVGIPVAPVPDHDERDAYYRFPYLPLVGAGAFSSSEKAIAAAQLTGVAPHDIFAVRDVIQDVLYAYAPFHSDCASALSFLSLPFSTAFLQVEGILANLLACPSPVHPDLFYATLLIDLCRAESSAVPPALGIAALIVFKNVTGLDEAHMHRLAQLLAVHVSNFEFKWTWDHWSVVTDQKEDEPQRRFVKAVLAHCCRLGYHERVLPLLPEAMKPLAPVATLPASTYFVAQPDNSTIPPDVTAALAIKQKLAEKTPAPQLAEWLIPFVADPHKRASMFMHALLTHGCKTFSHTFTLVTRYLGVFDELCRIPGADDLRRYPLPTDVEVTLLCAVSEVWSANPGQWPVIIRQLLSNEVVLPPHVIHWVGKQISSHSRFEPVVWQCFVLAVEFSISQLKYLLSPVEPKAQTGSSLAVRITDSKIAHRHTITAAITTLFRSLRDCPDDERTQSLLLSYLRYSVRQWTRSVQMYYADVNAELGDVSGVPAFTMLWGQVPSYLPTPVPKRVALVRDQVESVHLELD